MDGKSPDIKILQLEKLKEAFPEIVTEGKIDWEKLKLTLGEDLVITNERYVLNWAGKSDAFRAIQTQTTATLKPQKEQSVNFDATGNIFIEGENLEVLKVLQKSYYGKVKMIYIDPPYNTGNDSFIYPDKFSESKEEYLKRIGDKDEAGYLTKEGFFRKNSKESGQYHSNWLSMIYPRLFLARNLLRDDGVIFVSIDDNEVHNLRLMMNEIFGEENFVAEIANVNNPKGRSDDKYIATAHETLLIYKKGEVKFGGWKPDEKILKRYNKIDSDGRKYREIDLRKTGDNDRRADRPNLFYYFLYNERTKKFYPTRDEKIPNGFIQIKPIREDGTEGNWRWELTTGQERIERLVPKLMPVRKVWTVFEKDLLSANESIKPTSAWTNKEFNSERGTEQFVELGFAKEIFPRPKPTGLIRRILELGTSPDSEDIILDFFAGSGTTAQAVLELSKEDGGNRKFILVQLPEKTHEESEAYKAGYKTIADICKERIWRVCKKIEEEEAKQNPLFSQSSHPELVSGSKNEMPKQVRHDTLDCGFKVFRLEPSNFKIWRTDMIENEEDLKRQMDAFVDPVRARSDADDPDAVGAGMAWEILLKSGYELTTPMEKIYLPKLGGSSAKKTADKSTPDHKSETVPVYSIADGEVIVALEKITQKAIDAIIGKKPASVEGQTSANKMADKSVGRPKRVVCLDRLFAGNDQLKTNTALQMKDAGVEFRTI